jgi:hypothetical protein
MAEAKTEQKIWLESSDHATIEVGKYQAKLRHVIVR